MLINADQCWIRGCYIKSFKIFTTQQEAAAPNRQVAAISAERCCLYWMTDVFSSPMPINVDQCCSMPIKLNWYQCWSMPINADQWWSILINADQCQSMPIKQPLIEHWSALIGIEKYWEILIDIDFHWSALRIIDRHWCQCQKFDPALIGIERHWSLIQHVLLYVFYNFLFQGRSRNLRIV